MNYNDLLKFFSENIVSVYTVPQVAKILHTNPRCVRDLVKSGELRALKQGEIKISSVELLRFLTENTGMDLTDPFHKKPLTA